MSVKLSPLVVLLSLQSISLLKPRFINSLHVLALCVQQQLNKASLDATLLVH